MRSFVHPAKPLLLPYLVLLLLGCLLMPGCNTSDESSNQVTTADPTPPVTAAPGNQSQERSTAATDTVDFEKAFQQFFAALQAADTAALQQFIHPAHGLWIIEQPGAVPKMTHVQHIGQFKREYQDRSFLTVKDEVQQCNLAEEPFPKFDCADMEGGRTGYSKDGCFAWNADKFKQSGYWDYASLSDEQMRQVKNTLPLVQKSVLHTKTSFEFHFGYVDGHWRLLFAKLIYPCSA
ncbi:hypothetical protein [Botryobacter ruber]|uniref:hypothetical protein n=1 Tax=Botryobacter ruber TaxID=2171629 RepID=UPI000FEC9364|nr:hypothetical protein [Botryobacter ruber]